MPTHTFTLTCVCSGDDADWDGVGVGEAAAILGVSKQRVHQLTTAPGFPEPVLRLKATPVWRRGDIVEFAAQRRGPGRPVAQHGRDGEQG